MDLQLRLRRIANHYRRAKAAAVAFMLSRAALSLAERRSLAENLDRVPRNRAERRRLAASGVARVGGGGSHSPLLSLHRRIARDEERQAERARTGRYIWA